LATSILVLADDIFFLAKIQETAKAVGVAVARFNGQGGPAALAEINPQGVILDLNRRGSTSAVEWIRALKSEPATARTRIVAFASHVDEDLIAAAQAAGCDAVMARSAFSRRLPEILRELAAPVTG